MTTKGMLLRSEDVRAILGGATAMFRPLLPRPPAWIERFGYTGFTPKRHISGRGVFGDDGPAEKFFKLDLLAGDTIWVKECYAKGMLGPIYRADWAKRPERRTDRYRAHPEATWLSGLQREAGAHVHPGGWIGGNLMPRSVSRLWIKITSAQVKRIRDVTHEDALAAGCRGERWVPSSPYIGGPHTDDGILPIDEFAQRWDIRHGPMAFERECEQNGWVVAIRFERTTAPKGTAA